MRFLIILGALIAAVLGATLFSGTSAERDCLDGGGTYVDGTCEY